MAQHDYVVDNADGLTVRTDFNAAMQAAVTQNSGPVEPAVKFPGMIWLDTSVLPDGIMRQRNQGNTAWLPILQSPEMRFAAADLFFGAKTLPNRFVWNDKVDGTGTDIAALSETGVLTINGAPTAGNNVVTKSYVDGVVVPVGTVIWTAGQVAPANYLKCDGSNMDRAAYSALFAVIGTAFGAVDGTHFNLPDLRGEFVRGWDGPVNHGVDVGRVFGSWQGDTYLAHAHTITIGAGGNHSHGLDTVVAGTGSGSGLVRDGSGTSFSTTPGYTNPAPTHTHSASCATVGANETRPRNVALLTCIKYQ